MIGFFLSTHHSSSIHDITSQKAVGFFASWDLIMAQLFLIFLGHLNCTFFAHHFMDFLWSIWPPSFGQKWNSFWALCNGFSSFSSQLFVDSLVSSHIFVRAPFCKQRNFQLIFFQLLFCSFFQLETQLTWISNAFSRKPNGHWLLTAWFEERDLIGY